ncbi:glutaredoxin domain-containing protein [Aquiluna sp. KACHI24]|jgi:glutaredoxin-like protein|uniref:glutaredoxin family protein n=1 Tax=Aquiluna sp. KACHI24 TaxID=2968831 RepID=UPI00220221D5|nr:glutaredoxin domain-containing protein [Aquiluna sp. KACHI24]BDQ00823.1 NrdH-redoxin [Aquiluna sp. KACHI24]
MAEIEFYGADWCGDCRRSKSLLNTLGVEYEMFDVEESKENADKAQAISGRTNIPVIKFADGVHLVEPSDAVLHAELKIRGLVS